MAEKSDKNGTLYRREVPSKNRKRNEINCQVVLPLSLRHLVLKELHDAPIACETCIANTSSTYRALLHPHEIAKATFQGEAVARKDQTA
ncbi:hypothetical protein OUZ56_005730 [Daphnia magna]|uniref:Uncharacterized protein n=1 Tax=Daphnia magna TaxID=35525 RepID=A0ABQ9YTV6_9CRUS|nr:hypothetical protein OUZ56_005730 [Daphnia magna]